MARHLTKLDVLRVRERYRDLQDIDRDAPEEERLKPAELDAKVAAECGVSTSSVSLLVMGLSHPEAGGPIDTARRERRDLYERERESLGETEARRRLQLRARGRKAVPPMVEALAQRVTIMDSRNHATTATVTLAPGEWIKTELVAIPATEGETDDPDQGPDPA